MRFLADTFEQWSEVVKLRILFGLLVLFIASMVASCNETRYFIWGSETNVKIDKFEQVTTRGRYGSEYLKLRVSYSLPDTDLGTRSEYDDVPISWLEDGHPSITPPTVTVQYLPGVAERSRIKGHSYLWLTIPFLLSTIALTVFCIWFWQDYKKHEARSKAQAALYK